jgi:two-component system, LytTR family, sensor kinase
MITWSKIKGMLSDRILLFYLVYWLLYLLFFSFQRFLAYNTQPDPETLITSVKINLIYLPDVIIITHFLTNFIFPRFYFRNRFRQFYIILGLTILFYPVIPFLVRILVVERYVKLHHADYTLENYFSAMLIFVFGLAPLAWYSIARYLKDDLLFHQKLDNDRLKALLKLKETELKLLRSQLHPHFLFNTLNNIYLLALEKSDKTPDLIIRLGDMLSYIIYDCNSDKVPLSKEIDFIKGFIELQRVRFESCDISLDISGEINEQKLAPLILHTFVENSFKHGASRDTGISWIKISIEANNGILDFSVKNSKVSDSISKNIEAGIGIDNTRRRLELLYKERYELEIDDQDDRYSVFLRLKL